MEDIKSKIREFISDHIGGHDYLDDENFLDNSQVGSLFAMELVVFLEEEFDIQLDDDDLVVDNFASVGSMAALVAHKQDLLPQ